MQGDISHHVPYIVLYYVIYNTRNFIISIIVGMLRGVYLPVIMAYKLLVYYGTKRIGGEAEVPKAVIEKCMDAVFRDGESTLYRAQVDVYRDAAGRSRARRLGGRQDRMPPRRREAEDVPNP